MSATGKMIIVPVFVDDMFPACATEDLVEMTADMDVLRDKYKIPQMEEADVVLGMRIRRDRPKGTLTLNQELYTTQLVEKFGMSGSKIAAFPEAVKPEHQPKQEKGIDKFPQYGSIVGGLMYAAISGRPDIAHATSMLARSLKNLTSSSWLAAKRVLRYLNGTQQLKLVYGSSNSKTIEISPAFCDAD